MRIAGMYTCYMNVGHIWHQQGKSIVKAGDVNMLRYRYIKSAPR